MIAPQKRNRRIRDWIKERRKWIIEKLKIRTVISGNRKWIVLGVLGIVAIVAAALGAWKVIGG